VKVHIKFHVTSHRTFYEVSSFFSSADILGLIPVERILMNLLSISNQPIKELKS